MSESDGQDRKTFLGRRAVLGGGVGMQHNPDGAENAHGLYTIRMGAGR